MKLIERSEQLAALDEMFAAFEQSRSKVAIISGGIGTGKTALLWAFAEQAVDSGALFLHAAASRVERNLPLGVLEQMFCSPDLPSASAESAMRWLHRGTLHPSANGPEPAGGADRMSSPAMRGLWGILRDLAEHRPVVIAVDDVHHADETSLQCLLYLLRRLRSARLHVIFSESSHLTVANTLLHAEILRDPPCCEMRLEPLSEAGVADLLSAKLGGEDVRGLAPAFHAASAGYPLLVAALVEDYRADPGIAARGLTGGESFGRAVMNLLYRHEPPVQEVACAAAVLGKHASATMLGRILDIDAGSAAQAANTLANANLWENGRFRHDAIQAAIIDNIPPTVRMVTHGQAANLLSTEGVAPTEVAAHIVAADNIDAPWVIPILREAADHALANDDVATSLHYLRTAYQSCDDEYQRPAVASALADVEWRVDPATVLRYVYECSPLAQGHPVNGCGSLSWVTYLLWHGRVAEALGIVDAFLKDHERLSTDVGIETPQVWGAYLYPGLFGHRCAAHPDPVVYEPGLAATNPEPQGTALLAAELIHGNESGVVDTAEAILEQSRLSPRTLAPLTAALAVLTYNDRLDQAAVWCDVLLEEAAARRSPTWQALFSAERALASLRLGDLVAAERHADLALRLIPPASWGVAVGLPLAAKVQAVTSMGGIENGAALLKIPVPEAMFQSRIGLHYLYARGRHHLAAGRPYAALSDFRTCGRLMAGWDIDLPTVEPWRAGAAETHLLLGNPREARRLIDEQLTLLLPGHQRTRGCSLRVQAATRDIESRSSLLREAVEVLEDCGDQLELAYALADLSKVCGEAAHARKLARRARSLAYQCGGDLSERARRPRGAEPRREANRPIGLSDAEQRVAALAAEGYTNREISQRLYITVSTVEQHLTKIYRKLNVKRFDLQIRLAQGESQPRDQGAWALRPVS